jgi:hypothetical protein
MTTSTPPAGGRATEAGMSFQAGVGTWFAAHLAGEMPIGARFGLNADARPTELQFETGRRLDDVALRLSDGRSVFVQCKTQPSLSPSPDSDMAAMIEQIVALFLLARSAEGADLDLGPTAAVLAIAPGAPRTLDDLHQACRFFDLGGRWADASGRLSQERQHGLTVFEAHARAAWKAATSALPTQTELASLARLFHVVRFVP